jgi:3-O-methylgallate 3,4-dioxygenase
MARITLGIGTAHSPQLSVPAGSWGDFEPFDQAKPKLLGRDGSYLTYEELLAAAPRDFTSELTPQVWDEKHARVQAAIDQLHDRFAAAKVDVALIVGDDQNEFFVGGIHPTMAVYAGDGVQDIPASAERIAKMPPAIKAAQWANHGETVEEYATSPKLAEHLIASLMEQAFDAAYISEQPEGKTLGHAFTFVRRRVMRDAVVPIIPIMVNTYYPPNQPTPERCYDFGRALRAAVASWPDDLSVAIFASGGLSHVTLDEDTDQRLISGFEGKDAEALRSFPKELLRLGSSEGLNWITAAGACEELDFGLVDYVPTYRTEAGTGVGATFAVWQ